MDGVVRKLVLLLFVGLWGSSAVAEAVLCGNATPGQKQLLWGDLHVHTAWSLDAYAFGAVSTPSDAYAFARGQPLRLANGEVVQIDRPLDFAAVTDHAETFDIMYLCTDPGYRNDAYCRAMRDGRRQREGRRVFTDFLLPMITPDTPQDAELCADQEVDCVAASAGQWRRIQAAANEADEPCRFSALIGYEWSATPGGRHWHRNVIFRSEKVPDEAFDYVRYPSVHQLWQALHDSCLMADGCDALAIPHNINWADGGGFDVAQESRDVRGLRARYERLAEVHQEKGSSECLPRTRESTDDDCSFELATGNSARTQISGQQEEDADEEWARMGSAYYRPLLGRGLQAFAEDGDSLNPLKLGAIGSTDTHLGTAGKVQEEGYWGSMSMLWRTDEERLAQDAYNAGGLVAVWAEENTRASVFDALQRREAYATSGPRISLRFGIAAENACQLPELAFSTPMGGTTRQPHVPRFAVFAGRDRANLAAVHIIKGELHEGEVRETVHRIAAYAEGRHSVCHEWQDEDFDPQAPAYWYARVVEEPTPRWTKHLCEGIGQCEAYPGGDRLVEQRAWSSPVWYEPAGI